MRALASAAYTATAGHLEVTPEDDVAPSRRWLPSRRSAVVAGLTVLLLGAAVMAAAWLNRPSEPVPLPPPPAVTTTGPSQPATTGPSEAATGEPGTVVVHVAGAVAEPGVIELPDGARVGEAVDAAGGATAEAELGAVNLARALTDGEQVYVPAAGEAPPAVAGSNGAGDADGGGPGGAGTPVNINSATAEQLEELPGIGPALATSILEWRALNGSFTTVEDLDQVSGIGPATLERLRPLVTV
ncbi:hypothetical protein GCM10023169_38420 [Georgenia halophila]|uniref:Helix-hairpin-helix DNA-binding motif class 1 domain-containing protein n=1 Tax=Georgenia halophila TaxID=620889 RepID=A0ABP8LPA3_9MICO